MAATQWEAAFKSVKKAAADGAGGPVAEITHPSTELFRAISNGFIRKLFYKDSFKGPLKALPRAL